MAGVVDAVGAGVPDTWPGKRVVAHLGQVPGGYADQAVTAVANLFEVPDHVRLPDAVAAVGTGRTALGVLELEPPAPDDVVLVLSAAGGLGWLLVQSARAAGATVVAAASGARTEGARRRPRRGLLLARLGRAGSTASRSSTTGSAATSAARRWSGSGRVGGW